MQALLQRVSRADVAVAGETIGAIDAGLLVFLALEPGDDRNAGKALLERVLNYRIFADEQGRMNRSVRDSGGGVLLISQFTLAADTRRGLRPSFTSAMAPGEAEPLFANLLEELRAMHKPVASGRFGADMHVSLCNDGPVTVLLRST